MNKYYMRLTITALTLLALSFPGFAGQLDDNYLTSYGVQATRQTNNVLEKAVLLTTTGTDETPHCGTPLKHGLQRDWNKLEPATQKTLAKVLAAPTLSGLESTLDSPSGRFRIHYTTSGGDATTPSWVQTVAQTFDSVAAFYISRGWNLAPTVAGTPYDIYLRNLAPQSLYGQTTSTQPVTTVFNNSYASYTEIDNDFTENIYTKESTNNGVPLFTPLQSLQITAAHEYHHAIQYGYNFFFDVWYAEATSTWQEDEYDDSVNQLYVYLSASMRNTNLSLDIPTDTSTGGGYGRWVLNRHFTELYLGQNIVRSFWESLATKAPSGVNDIPMSPIIDALLQTKGSSLGNDLIGYASKLYTKTWSTHLNDITLIPDVSMLPTSSIYPITIASAPSPTITIPHYSFAFFHLLPPAGAVATLNITLTRDSGISAVAFRKTNNIITTFNPNPGTNLIVIPGFNTASEIVLLVTNTTGNDNLRAGFSTDGSPIQYALLGTTILSATPSTVTPSVSLTWAAVVGATSYQIYRSSTSSTSLTAYDTSATTSYTDTNVILDHTYYYSIIPFKSVGQIGPSSQITAVKIASTSSGGGGGVVSSGGGGGSGCFIATAAYGSYLNPQVQVLRDFRDNYLLTNTPGRAFVKIYYRLSPPVADCIARHETLKLLVRLILTPPIFIINNLMISIVGTCFVILGLLFRMRCLYMVKRFVHE